MSALKPYKSHYYSFNQQGECDLPSAREVKALVNDQINPIIFLDSNVCLNVIKVVDFGKNAENCNKEKVLHLKKYISKTGIEVNPILGIIELCLKNGELDYQKMTDFMSRISFFNKIPDKYFNRQNFDFHKNFFVAENDHFSANSNIWLQIEPMILNTYCSLLKIRQLSLNGLAMNNARKNIEIFAQWMIESLGLWVGIEFNLALKIFGGLTNFRKMIWLDGKARQTRKKLWGSAWDIMHARVCTNNYTMSLYFEEKTEAFFLTNDRSLFTLLSDFNLMGIVNSGGQKSITSIYNVNFDYPHLDDEFLDDHLKRLFDEMYKSIKREYRFDRDFVIQEIKKLEELNGIK
ncbi:MAG: hypothetical protein CL613_07095 [Aquimarina sp.]|nr:hypothetical protein [Aquimarina sp.]